MGVSMLSFVVEVALSFEYDPTIDGLDSLKYNAGRL